MRRLRLTLLEAVLLIAIIAIATPIIHQAIQPREARAAYQATPELTGQSYYPYSRAGTLNTSIVFDVTGRANTYASACEIVNDGPNTLWIEPGVSSVVAMTINSFPVYSGEIFPVPVRRRYYAVASAAGTTTAYRFRAAY